MHIFDNKEGRSFCTPQGPNHKGEIVAVEWKQVLHLGAFIFSAPTEAEPSIIVPDAGDGMDTGCISLDGANIPLGERFVIDAAAALVRDENN